MAFIRGGERDQFTLLSWGENISLSTLFAGAPTRIGFSPRNSLGNPFLINSTGIYSYGALHFSYLLDAFTASYGALHFSYLLGGLVEASMDSTAATTSDFSAAGTTFQALVAASAGAVTDAFSAGKLVDGAMASTGAAAGIMTANLTLYALMESTANAVFYVRIEGQEYPVWVMNTENFAPSRYTHFNFNSFARVGNRYYGANATGLYELTGGTDDGTDIAASIMLGRDRQSSDKVKRIARAYIHGTSRDKLQIRVVDKDGAVYEYESELSLSDNITAQRVKLGRGLAANYWKLEVRNRSSGAFEIVQLEVVSLNTQRKIRR